MKTIKPTCAITCEKYNYLRKENQGKLKVSCEKCRDRKICLVAN